MGIDKEYFDPTSIKVARTGMASFMSGSLGYVKNDKKARELLKKHNTTFKLVLNSPEWPHASIMVFQNGELGSYALDEKNVADPSQWDTRITFPAPIAFDFFMARFGSVIKAFLKGDMKIKRPLRLLKVFWFILFSIRFFKERRALATAMFWKQYNFDIN